jgi:hypothetical protein
MQIAGGVLALAGVILLTIAMSVVLAGKTTIALSVGLVLGAISLVAGGWMLVSFGVRIFQKSLLCLCPKCEYDLRGRTEEGCPECGWGRAYDQLDPSGRWI